MRTFEYIIQSDNSMEHGNVVSVECTEVTISDSGALVFMVLGRVIRCVNKGNWSSCKMTKDLVYAKTTCES